jgi:Uma2 family endonuclease
MRVRVNRTGLYTYPDIAVACPPIEFEDDEVDTLLNPLVIIEVLSPSTESYDRSLKFSNYRRLDSLKEYVLVSQGSPNIERYVRQGDTWVFSEVTGLDSVLAFDTIDCRLHLRDIYYQVNLDTDSRASPFDAGSRQTD